MTFQTPGPSGPRWEALIAEGELPAAGLRAVKRGGRQLVLGRDGEGRVFALDGRCPHEGYSLAQGRLEGDALTCAWHNWKFDVRDGRCILGGEPLRRYPTRVRDGAIEVDLAEPDRKERIPVLLASLGEALFENDLSRAVRDGLRLLQSGLAPERLLAEAALLDARRAEHGATHVLPLAADCAKLLARFPAETAIHAVAPVLELCGASNQRLPDRPRAAALECDGVGALAAAVEEEDAERAEGLLRGAFRDGAELGQVTGWLYRILAVHFSDFGHPLIYLVKAEELAALAGAEVAPDLYAGIVRSAVFATREDELPYMQPYRRRLDAVESELGHAAGAARAGAAFDPIALRALVLDGGVDEAFDAVWNALQRGVSPAELARALVAAAAERLLRFDERLDRDPEVAENWLWVTHRLTFAAAVRNAVERSPGPHALRLLFQVLAFVHGGRAMDAPPEQRLEPEPTVAGAGAVVEALRARDAALALARGQGYLRSGCPIEELRDAVLDFCLAGSLVRPIFVAHAVKTALAAFEERTAMEGHPDCDLPVLAALRFLASPVVERRVPQTVAAALAWVVEGRVPQKLTQ